MPIHPLPQKVGFMDTYASIQSMYKRIVFEASTVFITGSATHCFSLISVTELDWCSRSQSRGRVQGTAGRTDFRWCLGGLHSGDGRRRRETRPRRDLAFC